MSKEFTRCDFLKVTGIAAIAWALRNCGGELPEPENRSEREIARSMALYKEALLHPNVDKHTAAALVSGALSNEGNLAPILDSFDKIKPYISWPAPSRLGAGLAATPFVGRTGVNPESVIDIYEKSKEIISDDQTASNFACLAVQKDGNIDVVKRAYSQAKKIDGDPDASMILTSSILSYGEKIIAENYHQVKKGASWSWSHNTRAILTLLTSETGYTSQQARRFTEKADQLNDGFFSTDDQNAALGLAVAINKNGALNPYEMFNYATKDSTLELHAVTQLILATISLANDLPIICTQTYRDCGDDCKKYVLVPMRLS